MPEEERDRAARVRAALDESVDGPSDVAGGPGPGEDADPELPDDALREAERLTRLARRAVDDAEAAAYREERARLLGEHGFAATVREDEDGEVLVCHPTAWLADADEAGTDADEAGTDADEAGADEDDAGTDADPGGPAHVAGPAADVTIDPERIDDVDRAREVRLEGAADPDGWASVHERNRELASRVREVHGDVHGANADALAAYASNHYAKPVAALAAAELRRFREEYYPRNAWPTDEERAALPRSLELVYGALDVPMPTE